MNMTHMADTAGIVIPTNPEDLKKIKAALVEISDAMTMIESQRAYIKDSVDMVVEKFDLPGKFVRKMAVAFHAQTFQSQIAEMEDFEALYETVVNCDAIKTSGPSATPPHGFP